MNGNIELERRLDDLKDYAAEPPADLMARCLETIPTASPRVRRHPGRVRVAMAAAAIAVAGFWLAGPRGGGRHTIDPAAAYAATMDAMARAPYWRIDFVPPPTDASLTEQGPTTIWFDLGQGEAMRMGSQVTIALPSGDKWEIWKSGSELRAEDYHYPASSWTQQASKMAAIVGDPGGSIGTVAGDGKVQMTIRDGMAAGRPARLLTMERRLNGGEIWRRVVAIDPASGLIRSQSDSRIDSHGDVKPLGDATFDYSERPPATVFDPEPYLRQGYRKIECWPDASRRVWLDRDGKIIGRMF